MNKPQSRNPWPISLSEEQQLLFHRYNFNMIMTRKDKMILKITLSLVTYKILGLSTKGLTLIYSVT